MIGEKIIPLAKVKLDNRFKARPVVVVLYIPEEIIKQKKTKGLTLYFNTFFFTRDRLKFRPYTEYKIGIFAYPDAVGIGRKDYKAQYVKVEIIMPEEERKRIFKFMGGDGIE